MKLDSDFAFPQGGATPLGWRQDAPLQYRKECSLSPALSGVITFLVMTL
jgi:hypothetical protein